jgi:thioredoxin reductase (NADPH)
MKNKIVIIIVGAVAIGFGLTYYLRKGSRHSSISIDIKKINSLKNLAPVAIIGSGPAGLSAAIYSSRSNLYTVVFEGREPGGQLTSTSDVENWPGIGKKFGPDIMKAVKEQAASFGTAFSAESIEKVDFSSWPYKLWTDEGTEINALTVIIATGATPKKLNIPGEKEYWGKGVTTCAICDAPFFKDKDVVVVGGGDSAAEQALQLASNAKKITLLIRGDKMRASHAMQERLKAYSHITIQPHTQVTKIMGDGTLVTQVELKVNDKTEIIPINGVFLAIGHDPNSVNFNKWLEHDELGYLTVAPHRQSTSLPGIFAAGDVADHRYRQAAVASGDGIKAALDAVNFLVDHGYNDVLATQLEQQLFDPVQKKPIEITSIKDEAQFETDVLKKKIPVIVDFYTQYCPSCLQMMPTVASVAASLTGKVDFVKVDGAALPALMKRFMVSSVPCFLAFKDGMVVGRATSVMTKRELREFVQKFL